MPLAGQFRGVCPPGGGLRSPFAAQHQVNIFHQLQRATQGKQPCDVRALIKNLLRWSKISMLDVYGHVMTDEKIAAQGSMLERIMPKTNVVQ
jgi:hypothetical protein